MHACMHARWNVKQLFSKLHILWPNLNYLSRQEPAYSLTYSHSTVNQFYTYSTPHGGHLKNVADVCKTILVASFRKSAESCLLWGQTFKAHVQRTSPARPAKLLKLWNRTDAHNCTDSWHLILTKQNNFFIHDKCIKWQFSFWVTRIPQ